jgi:hypothetical protein
MDSISSTVQNGLLAPGGAVTPLDAAFPPLSNGLSYFMSLINPALSERDSITLYEMPGLVQGNGQPWPAQASPKPPLWPSQKALPPISTARYSLFYPCISSREIA